jgi:galactitol-specific phosphotransferase system IIB component
MAVSKLVLCICGAGIKTKKNALMQVTSYLEKEGITDIEVKIATVDEIDNYKGRKNMVVVWMMKPSEEFDSPSVKGISFLVGGKKAKAKAAQEIIALMNEIYTED